MLDDMKQCKVVEQKYQEQCADKPTESMKATKYENARRINKNEMLCWGRYTLEQ